MSPAYTLALKLGIPVIIQPEWNEYKKYLENGNKIWWEGDKLREKGKKLQDKGEKPGKLLEKGEKLWKEAWEIRRAGRELYQEVVVRELGPEYVERIDWGTGEVR